MRPRGLYIKNIDVLEWSSYIQHFMGIIGQLDYHGYVNAIVGTRIKPLGCVASLSQYLLGIPRLYCHRNLHFLMNIYVNTVNTQEKVRERNCKHHIWTWPIPAYFCFIFDKMDKMHIHPNQLWNQCPLSLSSHRHIFGYTRVLRQNHPNLFCPILGSTQSIFLSSYFLCS